MLFNAETQRRRDKRRALATTASWWNGVGNPGWRLACSGTAGGTGHRFVWPVVLRSVATNRQTTKKDRLSHPARRRINELRVGFRREHIERWCVGSARREPFLVFSALISAPLRLCVECTVTLGEKCRANLSSVYPIFQKAAMPARLTPSCRPSSPSPRWS